MDYFRFIGLLAMMLAVYYLFMGNMERSMWSAIWSVLMHVIAIYYLIEKNQKQ